MIISRTTLDFTWPATVTPETKLVGLAGACGPVAPTFRQSPRGRKARKRQPWCSHRMHAAWPQQQHSFIPRCSILARVEGIGPSRNGSKPFLAAKRHPTCWPRR